MELRTHQVVVVTIMKHSALRFHVVDFSVTPVWSLTTLVSLYLAVILPAVAAQAQTTSNTNCWINGRYVSCSTQTQPDYGAIFRQNMIDIQRMREAAQQQKANEEQAKFYERQRIDASNRAYVRKRVGEEAMAGHCQSARDMATGNGEFQLFSEVDEYCKARGN